MLRATHEPRRSGYSAQVDSSRRAQAWSNSCNFSGRAGQALERVVSSEERRRRAEVEDLVYGDPRGRRFTQRSPVMLDVWMAYALGGPGPHELLLIADRDETAGLLADELAERVLRDPSCWPAHAAGDDADLGAEAVDDLGVVATAAVVAVRLTFRQLLRAALPLTPWWRQGLCEPAAGAHDANDADPCATLFSAPTLLAAPAVAPPSAADPGDELLALGAALRALPHASPGIALRDDLLWLAKVAGAIALLHELAPSGPADDATWQTWRAERRAPRALVAALARALAGVPPQRGPSPLWAVHGNRRAELAMRRSMPTIKADAARHVFDVTGAGIRWAVLDSGVDATHIAFRRRRAGGACLPLPAEADADFGEAVRVVRTYDFTNLRELLGLAPRKLDGYPDSVPAPLRARLADPALRQRVRAALERTSRRSGARDQVVTDWQLWEPLLLVPHRQGGYVLPPHPHGTHVAGVLAADWRVGDSPEDIVAPELGVPARQVARTGVAPELELWDVRVLDGRGETDELSVVAALQFVRACNARHEHQEVHGVNLSLSLRYQLETYACGATPACLECERLVASGVVVVAAAGNLGRAFYADERGALDEGYRAVSITDPGNAPSVITVGATHRFEPHAYGVSYFSSRGPTGDGRAKPDLVAPGEKVTAPAPGNRELSLDGTSVAAPHVSGAAALLLARYPDLRGRPAEVKRILCATATDLGRDRACQGAGLLDVLRAMESR